MILTLIYAVGLVLAVEGLVLALAPKRIEEMLKTLLDLPPDTRRLIGLTGMAVGVLLIWTAKTFMG